MLPIVGLFGDSLTQYGLGCERAFSMGAPGWGDRLVEYFARRADVLNRGCAQYNTRAALVTNLVPDLREAKPKPIIAMAIIWFGANDACDGTKEPEKHVPLEDYSKNLMEMYDRLKTCTERVIFITPTPVREQVYNDWRAPQVKDASLANDRSNEAISKYAKACMSVASAKGATCIDMFSIFSSDPNLDGLLTDEDGLHFSGKGDALVFKTITDCVEKHYVELKVTPDPRTNNYSNSGSSCSGLPPALPFWDHIDPRNYRSQLGLMDGTRAAQDDDEEESIIKATWPNRPAIVCLGDSITQQAMGSPQWCQSDVESPVFAGWMDYLVARYSRRLDVYNRGLAGYNTRWSLASFERVFPTSERRTFPVELVTLFFGANDAAIQALNPTQHVSLNEFENNIEELVRRCKSEWDARRIVLIGCPPVDRVKYLTWRRNRTGNESKSEEELMDRTSEIARKYSLVMEKIAKKHRAPFIDLFNAFGKNFGDCLSDGLHLSPKGNQRLGDCLIQVIDKNWPDMKCTPDTLRKKYGFYGSKCHALVPEQKWFADLYANVGAEPDATTSGSKRTKL